MLSIALHVKDISCNAFTAYAQAPQIASKRRPTSRSRVYFKEGFKGFLHWAKKGLLGVKKQLAYKGDSPLRNIA